MVKALNSPESWSLTKLDEVITNILSGGTPSTKRSDFWHGSIPWITSKWLNDRLYLTSGEKFISTEAVKKSASKIVPSGNIVFATRVGVGKAALNSIDIAINQDLAGLIVDQKQIHVPFLVYQLRSDDIQRYVEQNKRGATIKGITQDCLRNINIQIPSLPEQQNIAALLSAVQRAIEQQERLITLSTELKKALMHKLFTEGTRGEKQKQTEIGSVPESWDILPFEEFTTLQRGKDLTKAQFVGGLIPVAGSNGIIGYHNISNVKGQGITVGRSGSAGKVVYYEEDFWAHNTSLYVKNFLGNDPKFSFYYLEYLDLSRFKSGASVPTLDRNSFRTLLVAVPKVEEQMLISDILRKVEDRSHSAKQLKKTFQDLYRTLLHQLMTAQIRLNDLDLSALDYEPITFGREEVI